MSDNAKLLSFLVAVAVAVGGVAIVATGQWKPFGTPVKEQYAAVERFCRAFVSSAGDPLTYESGIVGPMDAALEAVDGNRAAEAAIVSLYRAGMLARDMMDASRLESRGCLNIRDKLPDPRK